LSTLPTSGSVEADDWLGINMVESRGGAFITVLAQPEVVFPLFLETWGGSPQTTDTSGSLGAMNFFVGEHNGANADVDMAANSNAVAWGEINSSGSRLARMILKADDGELHLGNTTLVALDDQPDALVVRAMQKTSAASGIIETEFDNPMYDYNWLKGRGLAGEMDDEGFFLFPLQSRMHAHEGAIWQNYTLGKDNEQKHMSLAEKVDGLEVELIAAKKQLAAISA